MLSLVRGVRQAQVLAHIAIRLLERFGCASVDTVVCHKRFVHEGNSVLTSTRRPPDNPYALSSGRRGKCEHKLLTHPITVGDLLDLLGHAERLTIRRELSWLRRLLGILRNKTRPVFEVPLGPRSEHQSPFHRLSPRLRQR